MGRSIFSVWLAAVCLAGVPSAFGEAGKDDKPEKKEPKDELRETRHQVRIGDQEIPYTARAGNLVLKEESSKPRASVFFIAYTRDDIGNSRLRPLTFSFNGGPGSSSVWLHLGVLGPRRVLLKEDGSPSPPPYQLIDNPFSLLDKTDLVFIDPVSTGYSRPAPGEEPRNFHGVEEDIQSVGEFIRLYTTRYGRWLSPKFLIGESYGTTRAAGLSDYLQDRFGMYLNGIMLISAVLDFQTISSGNDLPYALFVPSYTATAWFHKKLPEDLQEDLKKAIDASRRFAMGPLWSGLAKGSNLAPEEKRDLIRRLAQLTGLSVDFVDRANLRIPMHAFAKELLRDQRRTVGRYDSRFLGMDRDAIGESAEYDPSYAAVQGVFTATLNDYVRSELKFESDLPYEILTGRVQPWNFGGFQNRYVNLEERLRVAMTKNPFLKVFIANGVYDLATPFLATEFTVSHLGLDQSLRDNLSMGYYQAGHMMYVNHPSLVQLKKDLAHFLETAISKENSGRTNPSGLP